MTERKDISIKKKSTKAYEIKVINGETKSAEDITGWTFYMTVKENMKDTDANAKIAKVVTEHTDPTAGESLISLTSGDTNLPAKNYYYSVDYKDDEGNEDVLVEGRLKISEAVLNTRT